MPSLDRLTPKTRRAAVGPGRVRPRGGRANRTAKFIDTNADGVLDSGDASVTIYGWDNRNRLVSVTSYATYGDVPTQTVTYAYDAENRWIGETVTSADGSIHCTAFAYDPEAGGGGVSAGQIVLQFDKDVSSPTGPASALTAADLSHRYLWGPAVDQILADEQVASPARPGTVVWPLTDDLGTVRDLAVYNAATGQTSVASHRAYDSFGNLKSQSNAAVDCLFGYTGRPLDPSGTGLQDNGQRWYDAGAGGWLSADPTGLGAGDTNLYRYCGNSPTDATDPLGSYPIFLPDPRYWWSEPEPEPEPAPPTKDSPSPATPVPIPRDILSPPSPAPKPRPEPKPAPPQRRGPPIAPEEFRYLC
jgi:RHS repeat-associated protein